MARWVDAINNNNMVKKKQKKESTGIDDAIKLVKRTAKNGNDRSLAKLLQGPARAWAVDNWEDLVVRAILRCGLLRRLI